MPALMQRLLSEGERQGGRHVPKASWKPPSNLVQRVVKEAGASAGQAGCIDLRGKRTFTVAEAPVFEALFGPRFAATGGA